MSLMYENPLCMITQNVGAFWRDKEKKSEEWPPIWYTHKRKDELFGPIGRDSPTWVTFSRQWCILKMFSWMKKKLVSQQRKN